MTFDTFQRADASALANVVVQLTDKEALPHPSGIVGLRDETRHDSEAVDFIECARKQSPLLLRQVKVLN